MLACMRSRCRAVGLIFASAIAVLLKFSTPGHGACSSPLGCAGAPTNLGTLPGGSDSEAFGISTDGKTVVGYSGTGNVVGNISSFRWTAAGGMQNVGATIPGENMLLSVSADGTVAAGYAFFSGFVNANSAFHAMRWTAATGPVDLGTLGGRNSQAYGVSGDGLVVVGVSNVHGIADQLAFRWTAATGMQNLGTLGGAFSAAYGTNFDGSVVVGTADINCGCSRAFRWTSAGMQNLGTFGGDFSAAYAVTPDGTVVVGTAADPNNRIRAFRWTSAGMQELDPTRSYESEARGVSSNGSVVVGNLSGGINNDRAFRWSTTSGFNDLTNLLIKAGVDMTGIVLRHANGVSGDGQFIVGTANFPAGGQLAYVVRYEDGPIQTLAGMTSVPSVQGSINELATARIGAAVQQHGFAAPLLGADKPHRDDSEVGIFGSAGSFSVGATGRYAFGSGVTIFGGLAYSREEYENAELYNATTVALAARYSPLRIGDLRPFAEVGGWLAPNAGLGLTRHYDNGAGVAVGTANTRAQVSYIFGRAGVAWDVTRSSQIVVSGELGRERIHFSNYGETASSSNPFEAYASASSDTIDVAKLKLQYSFALSRSLDSTIWGSIARGFNVESGLQALVTGIGTVTPDGPGNVTWGEYGIRLGYKLTNATTFDVSTTGISGDEGIGTRVHTGAGLRIRF